MRRKREKHLVKTHNWKSVLMKKSIKRKQITKKTQRKTKRQ